MMLLKSCLSLRAPSTSKLLTALLIIVFVEQVASIICHDCHSEQGTCNDGECEGLVCVKMETSNKDNDRRTVHKGCADEPEETGCQQSAFGSKWASRCVCDRHMCNADAALVEAGLEASSSSPPVRTSQFALLGAIIVFIGASCSLLVVATVCVQFC